MLTIKKLNLFLLLLTVTGVTSLLVIACNQKITGGIIKGPVRVDIPADFSGLDKIDHFISINEIDTLKSVFRSKEQLFERINVHVPVAEAFNKVALLKLLTAKDCVGIRIYQGGKTSKFGKDRVELRMVLVGVDSKGNDLLIDRNAVLAAKIAPPDMGGEEHGQCPTCLADFN